MRKFYPKRLFVIITVIVSVLVFIFAPYWLGRLFGMKETADTITPDGIYLISRGVNPFDIWALGFERIILVLLGIGVIALIIGIFYALFDWIFPQVPPTKNE